jgi:hypothetical protein
MFMFSCFTVCFLSLRRVNRNHHQDFSGEEGKWHGEGVFWWPAGGTNQIHSSLLLLCAQVYLLGSGSNPPPLLFCTISLMRLRYALCALQEFAGGGAGKEMGVGQAVSLAREAEGNHWK